MRDQCLKCLGRDLKCEYYSVRKSETDGGTCDYHPFENQNLKNYHEGRPFVITPALLEFLLQKEKSNVVLDMLPKE